MKNLAIAAILVTLLAVAVTPAGAKEADLVLRNGVIWTVDADNPRAEAVASTGDRIIYVGSDNDVSNYINKSIK